MLHRIEPRAMPLVARNDATAPVSPPPPAGSVVRLPHGDIAADFRATNVRGGRTPGATYELLVANDTPAPLATFAYAPVGATRGRITWNAIVVPPFSAIAVEIDVAFGRHRPRPRLVAELYSDEAQLTLDAPWPSAKAGLPRRSLAAIATALAVLLGAAAFAQARPHVLALAAPATVRGAAPFSVAYALAPGSHGRYVVETPDGLQVGRGEIDAQSGAFTVALPAAATSHGYDVRVWASGRFGSDERTTHVVALPERRASRVVARTPLPMARVAGLTLERDPVHSGEPIVATYSPTEATGVVRLIDALGTVRAEALLNRRGRSIIVAPTVDIDQDFRVVATAQAGTAHAEAAVPVTILHAVVVATSQAAVPGAPGARTADAARVTAPHGSAPIAVDAVQHLASPIVVRVDAYRPSLHVALMGSSADEISGRDVAPGDATVLLQPPANLTTANYAIVATYATGLGQETLIRPVTFRAP